MAVITFLFSLNSNALTPQEAVENNNMQEIEKLIDRNGIDHPYHQGQTLVALAVLANKPDIVQYLINQNTNINTLIYWEDKPNKINKSSNKLLTL